MELEILLITILSLPIIYILLVKFMKHYPFTKIYVLSDLGQEFKETKNEF